MWLVFFFLFFIFGIIFSRIRLNIINIKIIDEKVKFNMKLQLYLYGIIKIVSIKLDDFGFNIFGKKIKYKNLIKTKNIEKLRRLDIKRLDLKEIKFDKIKFILKVGTGDVIITSFLVVIVSYIITDIFKKRVKINNLKNAKYSILPEFNKYEFYFEGDTTISLKTRKLGIIFNIKDNNKEKAYSKGRL